MNTKLVALVAFLCAGSYVWAASQVVEEAGVQDEPSVGLTQQWRQIVDAEKRALAEEQRNIRQHWAEPLMSTSTNWIEYRQNYTVRNEVDFENNEIRISLKNRLVDERIDYQAMEQVVYDELRTTLSTKISEALERDPLYKASEGVKRSSVSPSNDFVFSELYSSSKPGVGDIDRLTRQLMNQSYVKMDMYAATTGPVRIRKVSTYVVPLPENRLLRKAREYKPLVLQEARQAELQPSLVYAVIHTESSFNPLARSRIPAYGLMQIVPASAGRDVSRVLFDNNSSLLTPNFLYNPKNNIRIGVTYINLLYYSYFSDVKNAKSRLYLSIAAYNAGVTETARVFHRYGRISQAVPVVNSMNDQEVLQKLSRDLPYRESREYLKKVLLRNNQYRYL
jgi:membrane-bound lytic murein transglycosylase C